MKKESEKTEMDWEALAKIELQGQSSISLTWYTPEGIQIKPLYTHKDLEGRLETDSLPGFPPYLRGARATMYVNRPWTLRQYAGYSTAKESNAFFRECLAGGQRGLSVAFDLPTHRGYDSDHPRVAGDVGKAGVAIDSVEDMKRLFEGIPLDQMSVSMTMNGAVLPILAFYMITAEEQGVPVEKLAGTIQNDILKEFLVRNTYIYPPEESMRIVGDIIAYCSTAMPKFNPISISGYHMHEAGATAVQELAYTLANGLEYVRTALARGLKIDDFAPRLSFFFAIGMNFFMEVAKLRAARLLWAKLMRSFNPQNPQSLMLRTHCQTSGVSLAAQDPDNNVIRTTLEALAAILGGTQSLHTNALDEALGLPTKRTARIARNTQLILSHETGLTHVVDPLGGSFYVERLTHDLMEAALLLINEVEAMGGMTRAVEIGLPKRRIEEAATCRQIRIDEGEDIIIGVNKFKLDKEENSPLLDIDVQAVKQEQLAHLKLLKATRDQAACNSALEALKAAAKSPKENLLEATLVAARARATLGEISLALEEVYGRYKATTTPLNGVFAHNLPDQKELEVVHKDVATFIKNHGRKPSILLIKLGQDGHDRGLKVIANAFSDCGFEVTVGPLFSTPEEAADQAIRNDVHVIGVSSLVAGHKTLIPALINSLNTLKAPHIKVICGGILPAQDHAFLIQSGVSAIFTPGTPIMNMINDVLKKIA
ncbi:MAG: methylmalonyl-CoA mutase [Alphaproteobacteria bacterium]|nr:methylmalonyl-CoA mutase [Alphaproteobacteria bacterium]